MLCIDGAVRGAAVADDKTQFHLRSIIFSKLCSWGVLKNTKRVVHGDGSLVAGGDDLKCCF